MTSKDRRFGGMFVHHGVNEPIRPWVRVVTSVVSHTGSRAYYHLVKAGHAVYVATRNSLFVVGPPSRLNYTQFAAGLP
jgi:hypothetical protein